MSYMGLSWRAEEVKPDTPYVDEPAETVPQGWYVIGLDPEADDVESRCRAEVRVFFAVDGEGDPSEHHVAKRIAELLEADSDGAA